MQKENKREICHQLIEAAPKNRFRTIYRYLYWCSSIVILSMALGIVSTKQTQPFYSWVENTRLESFGRYVAGLILEQDSKSKEDNFSSSLNTEEKALYKKRRIRLLQSRQIDLERHMLSPRDKRLLIKFPSMNPQVTSSFIILTNENLPLSQQFRATIQTLEKSFKALFSLKQPEKKRVHICFFNNRASYIASINKDFGFRAFHTTLGYYSPIDDCIYFFSRKRSRSSMEVLRAYELKIDEKSKLYSKRQLTRDKELIQIEVLNYLQELDRDTLCTLRHEAAHRLAHLHDLHSRRGFEKLWLIEGIAQYFETSIPGETRKSKKALLLTYKKNHKLLDWPKLINSNNDNFGSPQNISKQLAYAQSWLLVGYLFREHKEAFLKFIDHQKNTSILARPQNDLSILCKYLKISPEELVHELTVSIEKL